MGEETTGTRRPSGDQKPGTAPGRGQLPHVEKIDNGRALSPGPSPERTGINAGPWRTNPRRKLVDRSARHLITVGGIVIIGAIMAILFVILAETAPLFASPDTSLRTEIEFPVDARPLSVGIDEFREVFYFVHPGGVGFYSIPEQRLRETIAPEEMGEARIVSTSPAKGRVLAAGLDDGRILPLRFSFNARYEGDSRTIEHDLEVGEPLVADPEGRPLHKIAYVEGGDGPVAAALLADGEVVLTRVEETRALIGPGKREVITESLDLEIESEITQLAIDARGEDLYLGTAGGELIRVPLDEGELVPASPVQVTSAPDVPVTVMDFVFGDLALIVGDEAGRLSSWFVLTGEGGRRYLKKIHEFRPHAAPVTFFSPSRRTKSFLTGDDTGVVKLHHQTSAKTLLEHKVALEDLASLAYAPKGNGFVVGSAAGNLLDYSLDNEHPETSWYTLFGKVWYEGYDEPQFMWQSSAATDDFEPKLSVTPLLVGTLKGTFYALLFAVPVALLAALYTSQFMHPSIKQYVKPTVEIMAAMPSVVLGFLAGLWLAPIVENIILGVFLSFIVVPLLIFVAMGLWRLLPLAIRKRVRPGTEMLALIPVLILGLWAAFALGSVIEAVFFTGDFRHWLYTALGVNYDQRNSLVVGLAMGFAIVPIIFTIAEDSLAAVPPHMSAGSLALGATRWQTAVRVVLPTASPGIFSAIMIGLGRAVGETMIVLMATGNTPIMDWSIFNGFRAMSANIAVELPEAPHGGTLYRVLFLTALILFILTFIVNTAAEVIRLRLRRKYQAYA